MSKILQSIKDLFLLSYKFDKFSQKMEKNITELNEKHTEIREALIKAGILQPFTRSRSLKQITERGHELLNKHDTDSYLNSHCELLTDKELKNETDVEIFIKCNNWVKEKGQKKVVELRLNSDINEEQCAELLSLAIMEKIKAN
ncbi:MAG: hypothetical protein OXJ52_03640 [Oligoflexia bacterium]|nr:hypothetical protein [Oligoflexia bacterium]